MAELIVRHLGLVDYQPTLDAMRRLTAERDAATPDEIWLLQHPPVFTQGQAGKAEHVLAAGDIPVIQVERGGQVTYHGPGQLVGYLMLDLRRRGLGVRELVTAMEGGCQPRPLRRYLSPVITQSPAQHLLQPPGHFTDINRR